MKSKMRSIRRRRLDWTDVALIIAVVATFAYFVADATIGQQSADANEAGTPAISGPR